MSTADPRTVLALERHGSFVRRLARSLCADENEADDLVQETWLTTLRARPREGGGLRPWLERGLRHSAWTRRRSEWRRAHREQLAARPEAEADPAQSLAWQHEVFAAVLALDVPYREAVILTYEEDLTPREIAGRLRVPVATVRTRLNRARVRLRERLERRFGEKEHAMAPMTLAFGEAPRAIGAVAFVGATATLVAGTVFLSLPGEEEPASGDASGGVAQLVPPEVNANIDGAREQGAAGVTTEYQEGDRTSAAGPDPFKEFWSEVRGLRAGSSRFDPLRLSNDADRKVRAKLDTLTVPGLHVRDEESLGAIVKQILLGTGVPFRVAPPAEQYVRREGVVFEIELSSTMPAAQLLDLLASLAGESVLWRARGGVVEFTTREAAASPGTTFSHSVADLLLDPARFVPPGTPLGRIFPAFTERELLAAIKENVAVGTWEGQDRLILARLGSIVVTHNALEQVRVQEFLEHLRSFYLPLPEDGTPGVSRRRWYALGGEPARRVMEVIDSVTVTFHFTDTELTRVVETMAKVAGVELVITPALAAQLVAEDAVVSLECESVSIRKVLDDFEAVHPLRWYIAGGAVVLDTAREADGRRHAYSLFDVRGLVQPPRALPLDATGLDPRLRDYLTGAARDTLTADALAAFIHEQFASPSWDEDPAFRLRVTDRGVLEVSQTPRVLDLLRDWLRGLEAVANR